MNLDDELCLCFHVSKRKVVNWIRVTRPRRAGQLSECYGAGTGCGWCRSYLQRLFSQAVAAGEITPDAGWVVGEAEALKSALGDADTGLAPEAAAEAAEPTAEEYARQRSAYVRAGKGTPPPGATPVEPD